MPELNLEARHLAMLCEIFDRHLKGLPVEVLAYGSRLTSHFHAGSDLDLVLRNSSDIKRPTAQMSELIEDIRESHIPILVDLRDMALLPDEFVREIYRNFVIIWPVSSRS